MIIFSFLLLAVFLTLAIIALNGGPVDRVGGLLCGAYMSFYFLFAPILHILYEFYINVPFKNEVNSIFILNCVNAVGMLFFAAGAYAAKSKRQKKTKSLQSPWLRVNRIASITIGIGVVMWLYLLITSPDMLIKTGREDAGEGGGSIFQYMLIESLPILIGWMFINKSTNSKSNKAFWVCCGAVIVLIASIVFGGMRGSRVSVVINLISYVLVVHILVMKIKPRVVLFSLVMLYFFNSIFVLYKYGGIEALAGNQSVSIAENENRGISFLLHDLGRSDVQALIYERIIEDEYSPPYYPHTYGSALLILIPKTIRPEIFLNKRDLGTEAQYLSGYGDFRSSRIYGGPGEFALNFGVFASPLAFFIIGVLSAFSLMRAGRVRFGQYALFYPIYVLLPLYLLFYDLDNIVFQVVKVWTVPICVFFLSRFFYTRKR